MSTRAVIVIIILIFLVVIAPAALATGVERFFEGLGTMYQHWTND